MERDVIGRSPNTLLGDIDETHYPRTSFWTRNLSPYRRGWVDEAIRVTGRGLGNIAQ